MQECGGIGARALAAARGRSAHRSGRPFQRVVLAAILVSIALAAPASAVDLGDTPFEITADSIEFDGAEQLYVAEGHVRIVQEESGRTLVADWVIFSNETRRGAASGDVVMQDEDERVDAEFALFDVDTLQGLVTEGQYFTAGNNGTAVRLRARELVKSGDDSYVFWKGVFTTCNCPDEDARDPWTLKSARGDMEVGGYGTAWNSTLEVLGFPAFWIPWIMFPVKTERESGILFPEVGFGDRRGSEVGLPVFFAIGDQMNLLLTPRYMSKRGFKQDAEVEVVFGRKSWARMKGSFIRDEQVLQDQNDVDDRNQDREDRGEVPDVSDVPFNEKRWAFLMEGEVYGPGDTRAVSDLKLMSDNDHPSDFRDFQQYNKDRFLESVGFIDGHTGSEGRLGGWIGARWADDLQSPDDEDRDDFMLQRWTESSTRWLPTPITESLGLVAAVDTDYIHFRALNNPGDQVGSTSVLVDDQFYDTGIDALPDAREDPNRKRSKLDAPLFYDPNEDNDAPLDEKFNRSLTRRLSTPTRTDGSEAECRAAVDASNAGLPPEQTVNPDQCRNPSNAPEQDGKFQEGEALADEGHRISLYPRLSRPIDLGAFGLGAFELTPELGYRQNFYVSDRQQFEENGLTTARVDLSTRMLGRFRTNREKPEANPIHVSHLLEPKLSWVFAEPRDQSGDPVFVPESRLSQTRLRQLQPENVFRDPSDRQESKNSVILSVGNRFFRSTTLNKAWLADVTLSGDYEFKNGSLGSLIVDGRTARLFGVTSTFHLTYDPDSDIIEEGLLDLRYAAPFGATLGFRYRYIEDIPRFFESFRGDKSDRFDEFTDGFTKVNQIDLSVSVPFFDRIVLGGEFTYSIEDSLRLRTKGSLDYVSACKCWAIGAEIRDSRNNGIQSTIRFTFLGPGSNLRRPFETKSPLAIAPAF